MRSHIVLFGSLPTRRPPEFTAILMLEFKREATATSVPGLLCQSPRKRLHLKFPISLATWDLAPLSQHHCIKGMLPMKIYPYLSYHCEINETDVNNTCNLQKVCDSSELLNGNSCSLLIFIRSATIPMIS